MGWQSHVSLGGPALVKQEKYESSLSKSNPVLWKCVIAWTMDISEVLRRTVVEIYQAGKGY